MATEIQTDPLRISYEDPILAQLRQDGTARLRFSGPLIQLLDELSTRSNTPVAELMTHAVSLYKIAADAQARGESVCLVDDDSEIVAEITNLGLNKGVDASFLADAEAGEDES